MLLHSSISTTALERRVGAWQTMQSILSNWGGTEGNAGFPFHCGDARGLPRRSHRTAAGGISGESLLHPSLRVVDDIAFRPTDPTAWAEGAGMNGVGNGEARGGGELQTL